MKRQWPRAAWAIRLGTRLGTWMGIRLGTRVVACGIAWVFGIAGAMSQGGTNDGMARDVEWAVVQGKAGRYDEGLAILRPHLSARPEAAKAWYVSGFLYKERFKARPITSTMDNGDDRNVDRHLAIQALETALDLAPHDASTPTWTESAVKALAYLGGTYHDEMVLAVRSFEPGMEANIQSWFDRYVEVMAVVDPMWDPRQEQTELHKNLARAYRLHFEASGRASDFEGLVRQYGLALELSPQDMTAWYNLAVNLYNRGVAVIKTIDHTTTLWELNEKQEVCLAYFKRSLEPLQQAYALAPQRPETLKGLMTVHHRLDHTPEYERYKEELQRALNNKGGR